MPLSSGTVAAVTGRAAGELGGFLERIRDQIAARAHKGIGAYPEDANNA